MSYETAVRRIFQEHTNLMNDILENKVLIDKINDIVEIIITCYKNNNKVILFGCGGSAADSQHIAAEFINKFDFERRCLPAIALTTDSSVITAIGNDSGFENIFSRQVEGIVREHDVVIGISTSGKSRSVIRGLEAAKDNNAITIALTGVYIKDLEGLPTTLLTYPQLLHQEYKKHTLLLGILYVL